MMSDLRCLFGRHAMVVVHRVPLDPVNDGGWGLTTFRPDPVARLYRECRRCLERDTRYQYPQDDSPEARWLRGERIDGNITSAGGGDEDA